MADKAAETEALLAEGRGKEEEKKTTEAKSQPKTHTEIVAANSPSSSEKWYARIDTANAFSFAFITALLGGGASLLVQAVGFGILAGTEFLKTVSSGFTLKSPANTKENWWKVGTGFLPALAAAGFCIAAAVGHALGKGSGAFAFGVAANYIAFPIIVGFVALGAVRNWWNNSSLANTHVEGGTSTDKLNQIKAGIKAKSDGFSATLATLIAISLPLIAFSPAFFSGLFGLSPSDATVATFKTIGWIAASTSAFALGIGKLLTNGPTLRGEPHPEVVAAIEMSESEAQKTSELSAKTAEAKEVVELRAKVAHAQSKNSKIFDDYSPAAAESKKRV